MPTQGSANPAPTITALGSRLGDRLAGERIGAGATSRSRSAAPSSL